MLIDAEVQDPWEIHRSEIIRLYIQQKMKLDDVISHMRHMHGFDYR